jgi:hypothetical protein
MKTMLDARIVAASNQGRADTGQGASAAPPRMAPSSQAEAVARPMDRLHSRLRSQLRLQRLFAAVPLFYLWQPDIVRCVKYGLIPAGLH